VAPLESHRLKRGLSVLADAAMRELGGPQGANERTAPC